MTITTMRLICFAVIALCLPFRSFGAETVKLVFNKAIYSDSAGHGMRLPEGVACSEKSFVVADTGNDRLLKFSLDGGIPKTGDEIKVQELSSPVLVQMTSKGHILALDGKQRRVVRLTPDGVFEGYVEPSGVPAPGAFVPRSFKIDSEDNIYFLDIFSERVLLLDAAARFLRQIPFPEQYGAFSDLSVDRNGTILILDSARGVIYSAARDAKGFSPLAENLKEYMSFPASMTIGSRGTLYLSDRHGGAVVALGPDGVFQGRLVAFGWKEGLVRYPEQLCIDEKDNFLFVADRENSRLQIFSILK